MIHPIKVFILVKSIKISNKVRRGAHQGVVMGCNTPIFCEINLRIWELVIKQHLCLFWSVNGISDVFLVYQPIKMPRIIFDLRSKVI